MPEEIIYDVFWEGPYDWDKREGKDYHVLYQIYGTHPIYGLDALLYIGLSSRLVSERLKAHDWWLNDLQPGNLKVRFGSVGKFTTWEEWVKDEYHKKADPKLVEKIEALLIFAHKPAYNTRNKKSIDIAEGIRIFNTGDYGQLLPEISYTYYRDSTTP